MAPGLVIAVAVLGGVVAVLSFGFILHASRLTNAEEAVSAAASRLEVCGAAIRKLEAEAAHQDDVIKGLAGQIVTLGSRGTSNTVVAADWNVEPADVSDGIETKVYGD